MDYHHSVPSIPVWKTPNGRGGASIVAAEDKIVVFGGHYFAGGDKFEYLNEVWVYDASAEAWHKMQCSGEVPSPRYGHSAHIFGSKMFVFGGKYREKVLNDMYYLDLVEWKWSLVNTTSKPPSGRMFHAAEQVGRKVVIHGGYDGKVSLDDLHIFNSDSFTWTSPKTVGFPPSSRYG